MSSTKRPDYPRGAKVVVLAGRWRYGEIVDDEIILDSVLVEDAAGEIYPVRLTDLVVIQNGTANGSQSENEKPGDSTKNAPGTLKNAL